jgi:hypothetical protein
MRREEKAGRIRLADEVNTGTKNHKHIDPNKFRERKREKL